MCGGADVLFFLITVMMVFSPFFCDSPLLLIEILNQKWLA
jgi:hypothetical protein